MIISLLKLILFSSKKTLISLFQYSVSYLDNLVIFDSTRRSCVRGCAVSKNEKNDFLAFECEPRKTRKNIFDSSEEPSVQPPKQTAW